MVTYHDSLPLLYSCTFGVTFSEALTVFHPVVEYCGCSISDGAFVDIVITGHHLHYDPRVYITVAEAIVRAKVVSSGPTKIVVTVAIFDAIPADLLSSVDEINLTVSIATDFGFHADLECSCSIPTDISMLSSAPPARKSDLWLWSAPLQLLQAGIVVESVITCGLPGEPFTPCNSTGAFSELEHIADTLIQVLPTSANTSIFSRVAKAARAVQAGSKQQPLAISQVVRRESQLNGIISEHQQSDDTCAKLKTTLQPWTSRIASSLPWLADDAAYIAKLRSLLVFIAFDEQVELGTKFTASIPMMESTLYGFVVRFLRKESLRSIKVTDQLLATVTFQSFYNSFLPVLQKRANSPVEWLLDAAALWSCCISFQLRVSYLFSKLVIVSGVRGSGSSSILRELSEAVREIDTMLDNSNREIPFVIRRTTRIDHVRDVLQLGLAASVLVVGELPDLESRKLPGLFRQVQSGVVNPQTQRVFPVVSKMDECIGLGAQLAKGGSVDDAYAKAKQLLQEKCRGYNEEFWTLGHAELIAVEPRPDFEGLDEAAALAACMLIRSDSLEALRRALKKN